MLRLREVKQLARDHTAWEQRNRIQTQANLCSSPNVAIDAEKHLEFKPGASSYLPSPWPQRTLSATRGTQGTEDFEWESVGL